MRKKPNVIGRNIRALCVAVEENGELQDLVDTFAHLMETDPELMAAMHSVTNEDVQRRELDDIDTHDPEGKYSLLLFQVPRHCELHRSDIRKPILYKNDLCELFGLAPCGGRELR